jgi:peptide/nickel transport system ATP-binding protein
MILVQTDQAVAEKSTTSDDVLVVDDLRVYYDTPSSVVKAVDGVSFTLRQGQRLALVGESGSGKSTLATALMGMTKAPGRVHGGHVYLTGRDLLAMNRSEMRMTRLSDIALVPQAALNSLNPVIRVQRQIIDGIIDHAEGEKPTKEELNERVQELLRTVGLPSSVARMYPHELSGGMKQRVAMAIATSLSPKLIIADEPTSALDVVVQRQIMETLGQLQEGLSASVILIGHDMGLIAQFADTIGIMYAGKLVEFGPVEAIFENAQHPYTQALIQSLPSFDHRLQSSGIPGLPPTLANLPEGCSFNPRCTFVMDTCRINEPALRNVGPGQSASCHLFDGDRK